MPGTSCKDILESGDAQGDGEYWIDPTASGEPFRVYCDMVTDGGKFKSLPFKPVENRELVLHETGQRHDKEYVISLFPASSHKA